MAKTIGQSIREIRTKRGLSQKEVAIDTGISHTQLSGYEHETSTPNIWTLITLADYYNVSIDELIGRNRKRGAQ